MKAWGAFVAIALSVSACGSDTPGSDAAPTESTVSASAIESVETVPSSVPATTRGSTTAPPPPPPPSSTPAGTAVDGAEWIVQELGSVAPDGRVAMIEHDGELWFARPDADRGLMVSPVAAGSEAAVALDYHQPVGTIAMASTPVGLVVAASGYVDYVARTWISPDGTTWTSGAISNEPFDVAGAVWSGDRIIVSGSKRVGPEPNMGPFEAALFSSTDGLTWDEIAVDTPRFAENDGVLGAPVVVGDRIAVAGSYPSGGAVFESTDGGLTWPESQDGGAAPIAIAAAGDALVGPTSYNPNVDELVVIDRDGRWEPIDLQAIIGPTSFVMAYLIGGGAPVLVVEYDRPIEYCYEEPNDCGSSPLLVRIDETGAPSVIDPGIADADVDTVLVDSGGTLHLLVAAGEGLELRSWPASLGPVPTLAPIEVSGPSGPPLAEWGGTLDVGATYRFPLYTHCGPDVLGTFNGQNWWLSELLGESWVNDGGFVLGDIRLITDDTIEYVLDGRVVATYKPRPDEFPGCD